MMTALQAPGCKLTLEIANPTDKQMFSRRNKLYMLYIQLSKKYSMCAELSTFVGFTRVFSELFEEAVAAGDISSCCVPSDATIRVKPGKKIDMLGKRDLEINIMERPHSFSLSESASGRTAVLPTNSKKPARRTQQYMPTYIDTSKKIPTEGENAFLSVRIAYYNALFHGDTRRRMSDFVTDKKIAGNSNLFIDPQTLRFHLNVPHYGDNISRVETVLAQTVVAQTKQLCMHPTVVMRDAKRGVSVDLPLTEAYIDDVVQLFYGTTNPALLHHRFKMFGSAYMFKETYEDYVKDTHE